MLKIYYSMSGHFCDLRIISQWQKHRQPLNLSVWSRYFRIMPNQPILDDPGAALHQGPAERSSEGHMMSSINKGSFLPISFDVIEIDTWDRHQCVCFDRVPFHSVVMFCTQTVQKSVHSAQFTRLWCIGRRTTTNTIRATA